MKNIKDIVTTTCGIIILLSGTVVTIAQAGVTIPSQIATAALVAGILSASVLSYFTGKNPNGSTKSTEQVEKQNEQAKA